MVVDKSLRNGVEFVDSNGITRSSLTSQRTDLVSVNDTADTGSEEQVLIDGRIDHFVSSVNISLVPRNIVGCLDSRRRQIHLGNVGFVVLQAVSVWTHIRMDHQSSVGTSAGTVGFDDGKICAEGGRRDDVDLTGCVCVVLGATNVQFASGCLVFHIDGGVAGIDVSGIIPRVDIKGLDGVNSRHGGGPDVLVAVGIGGKITAVAANFSRHGVGALDADIILAMLFQEFSVGSKNGDAVTTKDPHGCAQYGFLMVINVGLVFASCNFLKDKRYFCENFQCTNSIKSLSLSDTTIKDIPFFDDKNAAKNHCNAAPLPFTDARERAAPKIALETNFMVND